MESLLEAGRAEVRFIDLPPSDLAADLLERNQREPDRIGPYAILRKIGEGGMGTVYQARQENPHRVVALKVIKAGMGTEQVLRRFEQEAEALGRLQHPGIAQIHEAGTAGSGSGRQPYFAMEFIDGQPRFIIGRAGFYSNLSYNKNRGKLLCVKTMAPKPYGS